MKRLLLGLSFLVCQSVFASSGVHTDENASTEKMGNLSGEVCRIEGGFDEMLRVLQSLNAQDECKSLECNGGALEDKDVTFLVEYLPAHVTTLELNHAKVSDDTIQKLGALLVEGRLMSLGLYHCNLKDIQVMGLAFAVATTNSLRELYVVDENLSSEGIAHIFRALQSNDSVEKIDFSVDVKKSAIAVLEKTMESNRTLQEIYCVDDEEYYKPERLDAIRAQLLKNKEAASEKSNQELVDDRPSKRGVSSTQEGEGSAKRQRS